MAGKQHVIVLGAGVTGLTSAYFLADAGFEVTIVAAHVPGDKSIEYTSPWAGAHWQTAATPSEPMVCDWDIQTYDYWVDVLEREKRDPKLPKAGLKMQDSYCFWDGEPDADFWWSPHVQDFRQLSAVNDPVWSINEKTPTDAPRIRWALFFRGPSIDVNRYLSYMQEKGRALGVVTIKARLPTESGLDHALAAAEDSARAHGRRRADCFINATGIGARKLCGDLAVHPIRGQTVLVKGEAAGCRSRAGDGYRAYCIPRPGSGTTILGGTKEVDNWNEQPDPQTTKNILENNSYMVPELLTGADGGFEVISVQCGLRPGRKGGPRMEKENVGGKKVVHAYGHSGAGYQSSIGSARAVVKLVNESILADATSARL